MMKRFLDLAISLCFLSIALPIMAILAILIRMKLGSPILFIQQRPGFHGKPFNIYKFRSMTNEVDGHGNLLSDEKRLTPFGLFLRRYSLDELPQIFNVLKGDLSLVGPRPLLMGYLSLYTPEQDRRHLVKPGITGWAQVNGRNAITWEEKFELDVWYVDHHSVWLDLKILGLTVKKVWLKKDISAPNNMTMPEFTGTVSEKKLKG
jgi:sugar transferase EpsL